MPSITTKWLSFPFPTEVLISSYLGGKSPFYKIIINFCFDRKSWCQDVMSPVAAWYLIVELRSRSRSGEGQEGQPIHKLFYNFPKVPRHFKSLHPVQRACMEFHELTCSYMKLHVVQRACMQLHKFSYSFMSLHTAKVFGLNSSQEFRSACSAWTSMFPMTWRHFSTGSTRFSHLRKIA